jgi:hypothetical protein
MPLRRAGRAWSRELHGLVATGRAGVQGDLALAVVPQDRLSRAAGPSSTLRTSSARSVRLSRAPPRCGPFYRGGEGLAGGEVVARGCRLLPSSSRNWQASRALGSDCRGRVAVGGGLLRASARAEAEAFIPRVPAFRGAGCEHHARARRASASPEFGSRPEKSTLAVVVPGNARARLRRCSRSRRRAARRWRPVTFLRAG